MAVRSSEKYKRDSRINTAPGFNVTALVRQGLQQSHFAFIFGDPTPNSDSGSHRRQLENFPYILRLSSVSIAMSSVFMEIETLAS